MIYRHPAVRRLAQQAVRFGIVGVINTLVGLAVIFALMDWFGITPIVANASGYAVGLLCSFVLNRNWTFSDQASGQPVGRFLFAFAVAYSLNAITVVVTLRTGAVQPGIAQLFGMATYTTIFFLLSKIFVFRT